MHLRLQHGGLHFADGENFADLRGREVRKADRLDLAGLVGLLHLPVAGNVVARRLVDQKQVDVVSAEALQRLVDGVVLLVKARPELGLEEDFLTRQAGLLHRSADGLFIYIGVGGVDETVAARQRAFDRSLRLVRRQQEGADAGHGHPDPIVQSCEFHRSYVLSRIFID